MEGVAEETRTTGLQRSLELLASLDGLSHPPQSQTNVVFCQGQLLLDLEVARSGAVARLGRPQDQAFGDYSGGLDHAPSSLAACGA